MTTLIGNLTNNPAVAQAFTRFGFGGRPDDIIPDNAMDWLSAQITCPDQAPPGISTRIALILAFETDTAPLGSTRRTNLVAQLLGTYQAEVQSILSYAITTKIPFRERLVWFWTNHFTAIANHGLYSLACAGPYVRDAIRPHITGTISEMLQAAILSPAMLTSLNGETSVGPQSTMAIDAAKHGVLLDINENLGRETLELYSLGYDDGYVQADVDALAYLLSGIDVNGNPDKPYGAFHNPAQAAARQRHPDGHHLSLHALRTCQRAHHARHAPDHLSAPRDRTGDAFRLRHARPNRYTDGLHRLRHHRRQLCRRTSGGDRAEKCLDPAAKTPNAGGFVRSAPLSCTRAAKAGASATSRRAMRK